MKELVSIVIFFCCTLGWSQSPVEIRTAVDRDSIKIGEQINLTLQLQADSLPRLIFQEKPSFGTFELCTNPNLCPYSFRFWTSQNTCTAHKG